MDRTPTRRPGRLRALLVAAALGTSLFATALPAAAAPPDHAGPPPWLFEDGQFSPQGFTWLRNADITPHGFTWLRSAGGDEVTTQGFTWR